MTKQWVLRNTIILNSEWVEVPLHISNPARKGRFMCYLPPSVIRSTSLKRG